MPVLQVAGVFLHYVVSVNTSLLQTQISRAVFVGQCNLCLCIPNLLVIVGLVGGRSQIHSDIVLIPLCSGFIWGEHPQNYLTCTSVLVSDYMNFYIIYDMEACACRSHTA